MQKIPNWMFDYILNANDPLIHVLYKVYNIIETETEKRNMKLPDDDIYTKQKK